MSAPNYNKPVFAATPIIITQTVSLTSNSSFTSPTSGSNLVLYTVTATSGAIIEKITVTITNNLSLDPTHNTAQLINLFVYNNFSTAYSLYKSMPLSSGLATFTQPPSQVIFKFEGGLLLMLGDQLVITTLGGTGSGYDSISVVLEGGSFDTV